MMQNERKRKSLGMLLLLTVLSGFAIVVCFSFIVFRPDRPVANIVPASSSGPAFVVQIIRPRLGLPLGGLLPPELFGLDEHLGFDSTSEGAMVRRVDRGRIELGADDWELSLVIDADGRVSRKSQIAFELVFEDRIRKVRCRPGEPAIGNVKMVSSGKSSDLSGNFDIELPCCEDADTGALLGWPPKPLILHGSFDRLPLDTNTE